MNKKMPMIALVDDDRNILTSVGMALEAEGYSVQKYNDGAAALQGLQDQPPDMAIFDIKMPRMDGMELLRRIRQKTDLPVIFLTSKDDEIDELFGLKMGADDFIKKPFSQRLLVERVKAVLRRAGARDGTAAANRCGQSHRARQALHGPGPPFLHLGRQACHPDGHRISHPAVIGPEAGDCEKPRCPDGRGL